MNNKIKILHLEDSLLDSELIRSLIEYEKIEYDYFLVENEHDYINILETEKIDIILSDYSLPDYNGNDALVLAREKYSYMPFIFVSGSIGEDRAINAMLNGATDYVLKNKLERLVPAIKRAIHEHELDINRKLAEIALHKSEKKYKDLINEVSDGYFIANNLGIITFANIAMAKILGFKSPNELTDQFNKTNHINKVTHLFKSLIDDKMKVDGLEMEVISIDGNSIYIEIKAVPFLEQGIITGMQGVIYDITERKNAEIKLKEKNELIKAQNEKYILINRELTFQNQEKIKRAAELVIANIELAFQNEEKEKRADELAIANVKKEEEKKYKLLIEEKNIVITDSINYAKRIQQAKLPRKAEIYASLTQSFVLFKPKDIVSGDFYFFHENNQSVFIVAADCTGHGVPGALMSMIGSEKLTDALLQSTDTSEILEYLNIGIKNTLHQSDSFDSTKDGMDIAICSVNTKKRILKYAGANIPLWIIRKGKTEVEEIKGTNEAIGGYTSNSQHFESHEIKLNQGDTFYISSDGYADQFGGKYEKKLMKRRFKEILLEIQDKSMEDQEKYLDNFIENWKGDTVQIDDILVIGVRL
jgi:PAS domain S-box-containing protein